MATPATSNVDDSGWRTGVDGPAIDRHCSTAPHRQTDGRLKCVAGLPGPEGHRRKAAPARPAQAKTGKTEINVPQMLDSESWGQQFGCLQLDTSSKSVVPSTYTSFLNIFTIGNVSTGLSGRSQRVKNVRFHSATPHVILQRLNNIVGLIKHLCPPNLLDLLFSHHEANCTASKASYLCYTILAQK